MINANEHIIEELSQSLTKIISETNGISISDTLEICANSMLFKERPNLHKSLTQFRTLLSNYQQDEVDLDTLLGHPVSLALSTFFKNFPLRYQEEHIHLTGSLRAEFIYPRLMKILEGPHADEYKKKIIEVYGEQKWPIQSVQEVDDLIRLKNDEAFDRYLKILILPKLILNSRKAHEEAAYDMACNLYENFNIGRIRLKFSLSRESAREEDSIPGLEGLTAEDVLLGLYQGFSNFQKEHPDFQFILSPSFRKEAHFFDPKKFSNKREFFLAQVQSLLDILDKYPFLKDKVTDVDTVGNERDLYSKDHFEDMRYGLSKLNFKGFSIRSHHGETWYTLKKGLKAVDNAISIWQIDTLEHGLSLGINPNFYFHMLFERVIELNMKGQKLDPKSTEYLELIEMDWNKNYRVREKLMEGEKLVKEEIITFLKTKFHTAREVEHYQHDLLNRMIHKKVALISLPSSNKKLTYCLPDYKDHPFSWWEKKGVSLGVGTDNYITLNTNFIREMLILLYTDPLNLKITKLLMIVTGEKRRPYLSYLFWNMRTP